MKEQRSSNLGGGLAGQPPPMDSSGARSWECGIVMGGVREEQAVVGSALHT